jgi:branched-chain amino acid transport system substrate-binding protein
MSSMDVGQAVVPHGITSEVNGEHMRIARSIQAVAAIAAVGLLDTACGNLDSSSSSSSASSAAAEPAASAAASTDAAPTGTIKVGFVSAETGPLAGFGEADKFVVDQMGAYFAENPIVAGGTSYNVEIIQKDAESDSKRAAEVAGELINTDGVDVILVHGTPEMVNPVSDQCEANQVPCISSDAPWQPYFIGRGGIPGETSFDWTYHFFWGLEDIAAVYQDMWNQVDTNKKVAGFFPNDPDGQAWSENLPGMVEANGYTINNPGLHTNLSQDYSSQISAFKKNKDEILMGVPLPPDFTTFWKQAKQQGFNPKIATIGKALLFPSSIEALGDIGENLGTEVWWSSTSPFKSSLTGMSAAEYTQAYTDATSKQWTQPLGFSEALFEVMAAAVIAAGGPDKQGIVDAMKTMTVSTIVGDLDWTTGPVPNVAKTPLTGGQWRKTDGGAFPWDLVIVSNSIAPMVPTGGTVEPLNQ